MGLINLRTNLKDLKFGNDEPRGGNSNQPFIQTRVPATDEPLQTGISNAGPVIASVGAGAVIGAIGGSVLGGAGTGAVIGAAAGLGIGIAGADLTGNGLRLPSAGTGGPDFLIRGGTLLPGILANDAIRLTKYFASTEGTLFTVKQNLLSRTSVYTQTSPKLLNDGVYTPLSTLSQAIGNAFGLHVNKQGLNPFIETGAYATDNERLYGVKVTSNQSQEENRLVNLYGAKILIPQNFITSDPRFTKKDYISPDRLYLFSYPGGPGSFLGVDSTRIRISSNPIIKSDALNDLYNSEVNYLTLSYKGLNQASDPLTEILSSDGTTTLTASEYDLLNSRSNKNYIPSSGQEDFRKGLRDAINLASSGKTTLMSQAPSYNPGDNKTIEQRVNLGDPGNSFGKNLFSYTNGVEGYYGAASANSYDKINALPIYQSEQVLDNNIVNDLIKFRIGVIDNNSPNKKTYIHFRAFLDQISDNYSSNWEAIKYIGRGENFYTYNGFDRKVSLGWTVAAQSKAELIPMYKKLNYLASVCAPDYSENGYMRGNIITLTIGGYFYEQPGIITSLNYEMNDENSSWEIGINDEGESDDSVKELPHLIRVTGFNFIPIHQFVPRLQQTSLSSPNIVTLDDYNRYASERYIALQAKTSNYNNAPEIERITPIGIKPIPININSSPIGIPFDTGGDIVPNTSNNFA